MFRFQGQPASGGLEIDGALLTLKEKREQLENELYYQFKPQIDGIEQCLYDIGEIGTLKVSHVRCPFSNPQTVVLRCYFFACSSSLC